MAFTLGGVTFADGEKPYDGDIEYVSPKIWAEANPMGYSGRIMTETGTDAAEHTLRCPLTSATRVSVKALADAGLVVAWVWSDSDIGINTNVLIKRFSARKNAKVRRTGRWDCDLVLVEMPAES